MSRPKGPLQPPVNPPKNIVVFGESGVGKSSLINLIAGRSIAATSSSAKGCTFQHKKYELEVDGTKYALWDTAGLDEGSYGTMPAEIAETNLKQLLKELIKTNGVHFLIYCVRASRLRQTLLGNYNLFYSAICRKKVPIAVVVTGLENYDGTMEDWWTANEGEFAALRMHFDAHACVTTLNAEKVNSPILKQRCDESRQVVLSMIVNTCTRTHWGTAQDSWASNALADVRAMFKPARKNNSQPTPIVAMYELPEKLEPIGSAKDKTPFEGRLMDVGGSPLIVYRIRDEQLLSGPRFDKQILPRRPDLLIFCASVRANHEECWRRVAAFYGSYGGDTRPLLIVAKDSAADEAARDWWSRSIDPSRKLQAIVRALPPQGSPRTPTAVEKIQKVIQTRALQPTEVAPGGCFAWLGGGKRRLKLQSGNSNLPEDALAKWKVWAPWSSR